MTSSLLTAALTLSDEAGTRANEARFRLLEAIGSCGSISAAAKQVGMSYKGAWDAVDALNNLFPKPLVAARTGGRTGGGAELTAEGQRVVSALGVLHGELDRFLGVLQQNLDADGSGTDPAALLWSLMMRTSARNMLRGTVTATVPGAVNAEVVLKISDSVEIVSVITNKSLADLGLAPGREAFALIKSSFIILVPDGEALRTSARNRLAGTVASHVRGAVNDEVVLDLGGGRTLTAIITRESADNLGLAIGTRAAALVDPSHVILAVG